MTWQGWLLLILSGVITIAIVIPLVVFVVRIFREAQPQKMHGGDMSDGGGVGGGGGGGGRGRRGRKRGRG